MKRISALWLSLIFLSCGFILSAYGQTQPQVTQQTQHVSSQDLKKNVASVQSSLALKKVLILHSFGYDLPVNKIIDASLTESFVTSGFDLNNLYFEFMDLMRNPGQEYRSRSIDFLLSKYKGQKFDLVLTLHLEALSILLKEGKDLYPEGPIISILGDPDFVHSDIKRPLVYLAFSIDAVSTAKEILNLFPDTQKIFVIAGSAAVDRRFENIVRIQLEAWKSGIQVEYIDGLPLDEILKKVANLPSKIAILYTSVSADRNGKTYFSRDVLRLISQSANAPVFGLYEALLGDNGVVGGIMLNHRVEGERAVRSAMEILSGNLPPKTVTILPAPLFPMFDWQQIKRWGLNESKLPAGSIFLNRPATFWESHKNYILAATAIFLVQLFLIIALLIHRYRRRVAEEVLRQNKEEMDQFFNISLDLLCIANTDGYFIRLNETFEKILGYTKKELMEKPFFEFVHIEDRKATMEAITKLVSQKYLTDFINRYLCKDGTVRWFEWRAAPSGNLIYAAARDITERKRAEELLQEEETRYKLLAENVSDVIWTMDLQGHITFVSPSVTKLRGFTVEEVMQQSIDEALMPDSVRFVREGLKYWQEHQDISSSLRNLELEQPRKDGSTIWTEANISILRNKEGIPCGFLGVSRDITQRKKMEATIRHAADEWQATFDSLPDLIMILDQEMRVARVNAIAPSFFALPLEELIGRHCHDLMHGTKSPEMCMLKLVRGTGQHNETDIYDQERRAWFHISVDPILDKKGDTIGIVHRVKDITSQKKIEVETFGARRELLKMERVLRMGELTASLAHELNQPLMSILSNARAALRFMQSGKLNMVELKEILEDIASDVKRAGDIIKSLRSMLRPDEGELELIVINDLLKEVISLFNSEAIMRNIQIKTDFVETLPVVNINKVQIEQVMINLLLNAAESMNDVPKNRKIVIRTRMNDNDRIEISVRDFGVGVDKIEMEKIFEPFFTTKHSGLGMGLSLSRSIIESHGGHIKVENNHDSGATFSFDLSVVKDE